MNSEFAARLERIESSLAHLERQFEQLNEVVIEQAGALAKLKSQQNAVAKTMETFELERIKNTNAKPPHYE